MNLKTNQKYMTQFMFGTFKVPATCVAIQVGFVSVCYETRNAHRDGFVRRCVAHSFPSMKRREAVSYRVETYRTEIGSLMAHGITFQVEFDCRPEAEGPRESCLLPLGCELFTKESHK